MKVMLNQWDKLFPGRLETIFNSLQNIAPSQMADTKLFDFVNLQRGQIDADQRIETNLNSGLDILEL
jgi:tRNA 2-thiocytidine biosynthesis protein TtcA